MTHRRTRAATALWAGLLVVVVAACGGGDDPSTSADANDDPTTTALLSADVLPVLVVEEIVPAGTEANAALGDGLLRLDHVTQAQFPEDAIVSIELIEGMVAVRDLQPDTIVLAGMFLAPTVEGEVSTTEPATSSAPTSGTDATTDDDSTDSTDGTDGTDGTTDDSATPPPTDAP